MSWIILESRFNGTNQTYTYVLHVYIEFKITNWLPANNYVACKLNILRKSYKIMQTVIYLYQLNNSLMKIIIIFYEKYIWSIDAKGKVLRYVKVRISLLEVGY